MSVATHVQELREGAYLEASKRDILVSKLPRITLTDIAFMPNDRPAKTQFRGKLKEGGGTAVFFQPLAWRRNETPRLLSIYEELGRAVNIQRFFGVFYDSSSESYYAVMEDLEGGNHPSVSLKDALSTELIAKASRIQRLRLCYEIALAITYLHSLNIIVKVISETSFYVKEIKGEFVPTLTNLEYARLVPHSPY